MFVFPPVSKTAVVCFRQHSSSDCGYSVRCLGFCWALSAPPSTSTPPRRPTSRRGTRAGSALGGSVSAPAANVFVFVFIQYVGVTELSYLQLKSFDKATSSNNGERAALTPSFLENKYCLVPQLIGIVVFTFVRTLDFLYDWVRLGGTSSRV